MPEATVIGLTGHAGSGKSTAGQYLKEKYGFDFITLSDVVKAEAKRRGLLKDGDMEAQKELLSKFGIEWRKETGKDNIVAEKIIERIRERKMGTVVIDGFRSPGEVKMFRISFHGFRLIYIKVDPDVRWKRRLAQDPHARRSEFDARDTRDMENMGLSAVLKMADFTVDNNGTPADLERNLDKAIMPLLSTGQRNR